jgi:hypothetical protein
LKNFWQGKDLKRNERKYNDKVGIIFLFSLISVVFFIDIYIEFSRIDLSTNSGSKIETTSFPSDYFSNLLTVSETQKSDQDINFSARVYGSDVKEHSPIKLSLFLFLITSFTFLSFKIISVSGTKNKLLSHYVSFVHTGLISFATPRPPPQFI